MKDKTFQTFDEIFSTEVMEQNPNKHVYLCLYVPKFASSINEATIGLVYGKTAKDAMYFFKADNKINMEYEVHVPFKIKLIDTRKFTYRSTGESSNTYLIKIESTKHTENDFGYYFWLAWSRVYRDTISNFFKNVVGDYNLENMKFEEELYFIRALINNDL